jgi:hypothetical protein
MLLLWGVIFFLRKSYISQLDSTDMLTNRKQNSSSSSICCLIAGIRRCVIIMGCFQFNCVRVVIIIKPWRWLGQDAHVTVKWFYDATVKANWKRYFGCADENRWELRKPTHFFISFVWILVCLPDGLVLSVSDRCITVWTNEGIVNAWQKNPGAFLPSFKRWLDIVRYLFKWPFRQIDFLLRFFFQ